VPYVFGIHYRVLKHLQNIEKVNSYNLEPPVTKGLFIDAIEARKVTDQMLNIGLIEYLPNNIYDIKITDYGREVLADRLEQKRSCTAKITG